MIRSFCPKFFFLFCVCFAAVVCSHSQVMEGKAVERIDPALDAIVSVDAKLEKLADTPGAGTREGPVWDRKGHFLLYSDMAAKAINKWNPADDKVSVFLENTDSNGLVLDAQGRVVWAARPAGGGKIVRLESDGKRTVIVGDSSDLPVKEPNDLIYKSDGALYFTDTGADNRRVYLFKAGKLVLLTMDFPMANGLALTPDEKSLYINDSERRTVTRFDLQADDTIANPKIIVDMTEPQRPCPFPCPAGYPDGMKVDPRGNIYVTGSGGIWIVSPNGKHLGTVLVPNRPANLAFGAADGKSLFITCRPGLYRIRLNVSGIKP
jgi:gluconolactonase